MTVTGGSMADDILGILDWRRSTTHSTLYAATVTRM